MVAVTPAINFTNSPLVDFERISPNSNCPRNAEIDTITPHHTASVIHVENLGAMLANAAFQASYNYGIGLDSRIGLFVPESCRCWGSSSRLNDNRAVVIGVSNSVRGHPWPISEPNFERLIELCVCLCMRNPSIKQISGLPGLSYTGDVMGSLTRHNMFSATTCPGPFLQARFPELADRVSNIINKEIIVIEEDEMPRFNTVDEIPPTFRDFVMELIDNNIIRGSGGPRDKNGRPADLNLTEDMIRGFIFNYRIIDSKIQLPDFGC